MQRRISTIYNPMKQVTCKNFFFHSKSANGYPTKEIIMVYNDKLGFQPDSKIVRYEGEVESVEWRNGSTHSYTRH